MLQTLSPSELTALRALAHRDLPRAVELGEAAGRHARAEAVAAAFGALGRRARSLFHRRRVAQAGRAGNAFHGRLHGRVPSGYGA